MRQLFVEINTFFNMDLSGFPVGKNAAGFHLNFSNNEPRPKYLGVSKSKAAMETMLASVTNSPRITKGAWALANENGDRSFEAWQKKLEDALLATKNKKKATKAKAREGRVVSKHRELIVPQTGQSVGVVA